WSSDVCSSDLPQAMPRPGDDSAPDLDPGPTSTSTSIPARPRLRPHLDLDPTPDQCPALTPSRTRPTPDTGTDPSDRAPPSRRLGKACLSELFALRWSLRVDRASGALSGRWAAGALS